MTDGRDICICGHDRRDHATDINADRILHGECLTMILDNVGADEGLHGPDGPCMCLTFMAGARETAPTRRLSDVALITGGLALAFLQVVVAHPWQFGLFLGLSVAAAGGIRLVDRKADLDGSYS